MPPRNIFVFLCSETAFGGKYLLKEPNYVQKSGGGAVAPAPCPLSHTPLLWHLASLHHANGGQFLHQPVHDHYQPFLILT